MLQRKDKSKHDYILKSFSGILRTKKYKNIKADIEGFERPHKLYWENSEIGYTLDITAIYDKIYSSTEVYVFEVETEDSIDDPHTKDKCQIFATYGKEFQRRFIVIVPKSCKQKVG